VCDPQAFKVLLHYRHRKSSGDHMDAGASLPNEQSDDSGQAFGPIAGPELLALRRHAADQVMVNAIVGHVGGIYIDDVILRTAILLPAFTSRHFRWGFSTTASRTRASGESRPATTMTSPRFDADDASPHGNPLRNWPRRESGGKDWCPHNRAIDANRQHPAADK
jgi:hypothetical protein